jgi:hypothetical protein
LVRKRDVHSKEKGKGMNLLERPLSTAAPVPEAGFIEGFLNEKAHAGQPGLALLWGGLLRGPLVGGAVIMGIERGGRGGGLRRSNHLLCLLKQVLPLALLDQPAGHARALAKGLAVEGRYEVGAVVPKKIKETAGNRAGRGPKRICSKASNNAKRGHLVVADGEGGAFGLPLGLLRGVPGRLRGACLTASLKTFRWALP